MENVPQHDPLFLAWAAGFIDGEGCFSICVRSKSSVRTIVYEPILVVAQNDIRPLRELQEAFGGFVSGRILRPGNRRDHYQWRLAPRPMAAMLPLLLPYFRVKREPAELMLQFLALSLRQGRPNGRAGIPPDEMRQREHLRQKLREINAWSKGKTPVSDSPI